MVHHAIAAGRPNPLELVPHTAYQVDFAAVNCGKMVASSKRNIRFKFGYTNLEALSSGKRGNDCRGAEHEILVDWSISSGKQAIVFDSQEVFFDVGAATQTKIKYSWKDPLGHILEVKIHAANMSTKQNPHPEWRQYDLFIDGVSFFRMPKIFEIGVGLKEAYTLAPSLPGDRDNSRYSPQDRQSDPTTNFPVEKTKTPEPKPSVVADLLSFDDLDAQPVNPAPPQRAPTQVRNDFAPSQASAEVINQYAPTQASIHFSNNDATSRAPVNFNNYPTSQSAPSPAPVQQSYKPSSNPFSAPTNPFENSIANYASPTASPGTAQYLLATYQFSSPYQPSYVTPNPSASYQPQTNCVTTNCVTPSSSCSALVPAEPISTGVDGALKKLVNIDDLFAYHCKSTTPPTNGSATTMHQANGHMSLGQLQGSKKPAMDTYNTVPYSQQQGTFSGNAAQQPQQPQFNKYAQQSYAQPGFGYK